MRRRRPLLATIVLGAFWIVVIIAANLLGAMVEPDAAVSALETHGFSEVEIREKVIFFAGLRGCGRGDSALFRARAKNPVGKMVDVNVCVGWPLKGATVRTP